MQFQYLHLKLVLFFVDRNQVISYFLRRTIINLLYSVGML
jgi:hypothetical protein